MMATVGKLTELLHWHFFEPVTALCERRAWHQLSEKAYGIARPIHRGVLIGMAEGKER